MMKAKKITPTIDLDFIIPKTTADGDASHDDINFLKSIDITPASKLNWDELRNIEIAYDETLKADDFNKEILNQSDSTPLEKV